MAFFGTAVDALKTVVIALGAGLGLRRGELCGLEWKDFDFEKKTIYICRSSQYVNGKIITKEPSEEYGRILTACSQKLKALRYIRIQSAIGGLSSRKDTD